jgi:hypothetical protein
MTTKVAVESLLEVRVGSANDDEPQVTLLHGAETEQVVKAALLRVRVEQQEALEEEKRRAKEAKRIQRESMNGDEEEEEEEEEQEEE